MNIKSPEDRFYKRPSPQEAPMRRGLFGEPELPGLGWEKGNMFTDTLFVPNCNMEAGAFHDTVWQEGSPDRVEIFDGEYGQMMGELFYNDAVRRLQAIEQLTLPPHYSTVPNTGAFSRFEHVLGSVLFVRQMCEMAGIEGREATVLQLRTFVSDIAQTFGSHLGDWMFQGIGAEENQHDIDLMAYLEAVGINDILRKYGFEPEEIVFPEIADWVEAPPPNLCVDRVDYGLREMNRTNEVIRDSNFSSADLTITPDGMLAMKDQQRARLFGEGFLLLSETNWAEPIHRFIEDMLILRNKVFYAEGRTPTSWVFSPDVGPALVPLHEIHPRDLMYVTDHAQLSAYSLYDPEGHKLDEIMRGVACHHRQYAWPNKQQKIKEYMEQFADNERYEQILRCGSFERLEDVEYDPSVGDFPAHLITALYIIDADEAEATKGDDFIDIPQPPFKIRQTDPLVETEEGFQHLSELDPSFKKRLQEHREKMSTAKVARLVVADPEMNALLRSMINNIEEQWQDRLQTTRRMTTNELRSLVGVAAREVHGSYPFMTFQEF